MSKQKKPKYPQFSLTWLYVIIAVVLGYLILNGGSGSLLDGGSKEVTYSQLRQERVCQQGCGEQKGRNAGDVCRSGASARRVPHHQD